MIPAIRHPDFPFTRTSISVNRTLLPLQLVLRPRISLRWHDAVYGTVLDLGACQNHIATSSTHFSGFPQENPDIITGTTHPNATVLLLIGTLR